MLIEFRISFKYLNREYDYESSHEPNRSSSHCLIWQDPPRGHRPTAASAVFGRIDTERQIFSWRDGPDSAPWSNRVACQEAARIRQSRPASDWKPGRPGSVAFESSWLVSRATWRLTRSCAPLWRQVRRFSVSWVLWGSVASSTPSETLSVQFSASQLSSLWPALVA